MGRPSPRRRTLTASIAVTASIAAVALGASPALADTAPTGGLPATVTTDALAAPQINGVVWSQIIIGNTVYAGGSFTKARPAGSAVGKNQVTRTDLLAYDITTGDLISSFDVTLNGQVRGLAASADGSTVYAVGDFTKADGASHSRVVALNATTGDPVSGFKASVNASAYAATVKNGVVYVGGEFTKSGSSTRNHVAAFDATTGSLKAFAPSTDAPVRGIQVSPDGASVVIAGNFAKVNGSTAYASAKVDSATGKKNQTWKVNQTVQNHTVNAGLYSLTSDSTYVYATGWSYHPVGSPHRMEGTFVASWKDGTIHWIEDCHGDEYSSTVVNGVVYIAGHPHDCARVVNGWSQSSSANPQRYQRGLAFSLTVGGTLKNVDSGSQYSNFGGQPSPTLLTWFPSFNTGTVTGQSQGPWSVASNSEYVVYGGEFTTVNGKAQQGLVRFAVPTDTNAADAALINKDGPRLSGDSFEPTLTASAGQVTVKWTQNFDRDNALLTYQVIRGTPTTDATTGKTTTKYEVVYTTQSSSPTAWFGRKSLSFTDTGLTKGVAYTYRLTAADPFGNTAKGTTVTVTAK